MLVMMVILLLQIPQEKEMEGASRSNSTKFLAPLLLKVHTKMCLIRYPFALDIDGFIVSCKDHIFDVLT